MTEPVDPADDADDPRPGPPLPPEDRLWRHPSELAASGGSRPAPPAGSGPPARQRRRSLLAVALVSGLAGATITLASVAVLGPSSRGGRDGPAAASTTTLTRPVSAAASSVAPAVVEVTAQVGTVQRRGSGVVARADGLIVTSALLVAGAGRVEVAWGPGRREEAAVAGVDELTGLAALSVDASRMPTAAIDISMPRPGDEAFTVAASTGSDGPAVRPGTVSATGSHADPEGGRLLGLIATDRPVPGWADGGALVDAEGRLRGVSLSVPRAEEGWAVPVEVALRVADDLRRLGRVDRGWLGVAGSTSASAGTAPAGMVVEHVAPGSPAAAAGLQAGDVLIAVGDQRVRSLADVKAALTLTRPGQAVTVERSRGGTLATAAVDLADAPG